MQLSEQQMRFFDQFGYLVLPQVFDPLETDEIISQFEHTIQTFGGGQNHDITKRTMFLGPIDRTPEMARLLDDPRVVGIASSILGDDFNYASGDGNYYSGDTVWHSDGGWRQLFAIKIAFYLDPVRRDTGCLRVIPGSQKADHPLHNGAPYPGKSLEAYGVEPRDYPGNVAAETNPGDVLVFNHDLWHAAFGGGERRRMFTMNFTRAWHNDAERELCVRYASQHSPGGHKLPVGKGMYGDAMRDTADAARRVHLEQYDAIHAELFGE